MKRTPFFLAVLLLFAAVAIAFALALSNCVTATQTIDDPPIDDSTSTAKTAAKDTTNPNPERYPDVKPPSPKH